MTTEIPLVEIAKLKEILQDVASARSDLEISLDELHRQLTAAKEADQDRTERQGAVEDRVQGLQSELESAKRQLSSAASERDRARRELSILRDSVERAMRQSTADIYRAIDRRDPFEQLEQLKKGKREADSRNATLSNENRQLQSSVRELQTRVEELEASAAGYRSELEARAVQLERLNGLASRYKDEIARHASQLEEVRRESQQAVLRDLIHQVTPRRLAELMDAVEDPARAIAADSDTVKFVEWLIQHLKSIGLRVTHRLDEQLSIRESDLRFFRLDEEYRAGSMFQVTAPGFALGDDVLIRAKVRYLEKEDRGGSEESGYEPTDEAMSRGAEAPGTGGGGDLADDQEI